MTLLLKAPYGYKTPGSVRVSLRRMGSMFYNRNRFFAALHWHSCYPPSIPKIISCIESSGRYDCSVTIATAREIRRDDLLERAGVVFITLDPL